MKEPAITLEQVDMNFTDVRALRRLDLTVNSGEVLGLLGHNGAGKTTTMKLVLGLLRPTAGKINVLGHQPWAADARPLRYRLGYLPENVSFYDQLSGREVLAYFARLKRAAAATVDTLLARVGLAEVAGRRVRTYSKGMRQRLGLAQALLGEPRLLLLDEPTVGLDPVATQSLFEIIDELREGGCTIILSSHVLPGVERHIDRAAILGAGRLLALGTLHELRQIADLPVTITARHAGRPFELPPALARSASPPRRVNGHHVEIDIPPAHKVEALRALLDSAAVDDVEISAPSLERLYTHFNGTTPPGTEEMP